MSKRQKFVIATIVLFAGIVISRVGLGEFLQWRFRAVLFSLVSIGVTVWAIFDEDFGGIEWLTLPLLPVLFSLSSLLIFPLLPEIVGEGDAGFVLAVLLKSVFLVLFLVGYYASLLTANIYNVAAIRTIQLLRVAHSIGFLLTVATALFFYYVLASFHLPSFVNFLFVFAVTALLAFPAIWSVNLEERLTPAMRNYTLLTALVLSQTAWVLSFWPVSVSIFSIFLTAILYEIIGIVQFHLGEKLNPRVANEFIFVAVAIFLLTFFTSQWGT